ncbi:MAG: ubiquinone/menaquinone biosynthesis methyltransferase, partial [Deltaproteobacteria bacterium]|nr:ubiquinone/menaquinone biosynthesis methyltransferase [Deltaproteobacteria bacterium]
RMKSNRQPEWNRRMKKMFSGISRRYDLLNTLMTFGRDRRWRETVIGMTGIRAGGLLLDAGAGTGKIAHEALLKEPLINVIAADLTPEMMKVGRENSRGTNITWCCADALDLPFCDNTFDAVTSGYLIRNVPDIIRCFSEQFRVVKPGGKVVCLDTAPPPDTLLKPLVLFHLKVVIPVIGGLISGKWDAYQYLPESTRSFKTPEEISGIMLAAGFTDIEYTRYMFGTIVIIKGTRPLMPPS